MANKKHLLHVCSYTWETGGPASVIHNHAAFEKANGYDVSIASAVSAHQTPYPVPSGVHLFTFANSFFSKIMSEFSWPLIFWFWKNNSRFTHIHVHGLWYFGSLLPFLIPNTAKKIISIHGFLDPYAMGRSTWKKKLLWFLMQKRFIQRADLIHVISRDEERIVRQLFPELIDKIHYIPNGIPDPLMQSQDQPLVSFKDQIDAFRAKEKFTILFLSRKNRKKGLDILLEAFAKSDGATFNLIIAGPQDDYSAEINAFMQSYHGDGLLVLDVVTGANKHYLLSNVDGFILPSYSEGFSIAALEAIAYQKPCIFSDRIGFAEDVIAHNAAIICDTTADSILQACMTLASPKTDRKAMAFRARNLYLAEYQIEKVAQDFVFALNHIN